MKNGLSKFDSKVYLAHWIQLTIPKLQILHFFNQSDYFWRKTTINKQTRIVCKICYHWSKNSWNFWLVGSKLVVGSGEQDTSYFQQENVYIMLVDCSYPAGFDKMWVRYWHHKYSWTKEKFQHN